MSRGYRVLSLDEIPTRRFPGEPVPDWKPVRRTLGIRAFGTNAYVGEQVGDVIVEPHDEQPWEGSPGPGHQEIYLVLDGSARFTVDGESFEVGRGGIVFVEDPAMHRGATALEPGTIVFTVGAPAGEPFEVSEWEQRFIDRAAPLEDS